MKLDLFFFFGKDILIVVFKWDLLIFGGKFVLAIAPPTPTHSPYDFSSDDSWVRPDCFVGKYRLENEKNQFFPPPTAEGKQRQKKQKKKGNMLGLFTHVI